MKAPDLTELEKRSPPIQRLLQLVEEREEFLKNLAAVSQSPDPEVDQILTAKVRGKILELRMWKKMLGTSEEEGVPDFEVSVEPSQ